MSDDAESVSARLQHLLFHDRAIVPHHAIACKADDKLGRLQEQRRPELFPAGILRAAAESGGTPSEIDVALHVQVELPRKAPRRRVGVTSLRMKRKWEAQLVGVTCLKMKKRWEARLIHRLPPGVHVTHGRKKRRPAVQFLGFFDTADQAQQAYDKAVMELTMLHLQQIQLADNADHGVVPVVPVVPVNNADHGVVDIQ